VMISVAAGRAPVALAAREARVVPGLAAPAVVLGALAVPVPAPVAENLSDGISVVPAVAVGLEVPAARVATIAARAPVTSRSTARRRNLAGRW
jgi:hypothetical protein